MILTKFTSPIVAAFCSADYPLYSFFDDGLLMGGDVPSSLINLFDFLDSDTKKRCAATLICFLPFV